MDKPSLNRFNNKKFQLTKNLGKAKASDKVMSYSEGSQFDRMMTKIKNGK